MEVTFTCSIADIDDLDSQSVIVKSISFKDEDVKKALRSVSFNGRLPELELYGSRKVMLDKSLSFNMASCKTHSQYEVKKMSVRPEICKNENNCSSILQRSNSLAEKNSHLKLSGKRYQAALKWQKVCKSSRTRRSLADCAVVKQRWWKLLGFAELMRNSISFFEMENPETAISRWSRASKRAAKVGQGLSKDKKARKLAWRHWLEAIDPRHRYGHNLQFYFAKWHQCDSKQPFFYWLDIGEGKEVNLEKCSRSKLQQQCIKYLYPTERDAYEVIIKNGKFVYKQSGKLLHTTEGSKDAKWIFVLSAFKILYVGQKIKGTFQHSSFLAGGATLSAGRLVAENGVLKAAWPHSGHYRPTPENFLEFMSFLREHNVDITNVETIPPEEEETLSRKKSSLRSKESEAEDMQEQTEETNNKNSPEENSVSRNIDSNSAENTNKSIPRLSRVLLSKINKLEIPAREEGFDIFKTETLPPSCHHEQPEFPTDDGYETAEEFYTTKTLWSLRSICLAKKMTRKMRSRFQRKKNHAKDRLA